MHEPRIELRFKKLSNRARTPTRSSDRSAGLNLYPRCKYTIPAHSRRVCMTDIAIELPPNHYGRISSNSKLAVMHGIVVETGSIDETYTGQIGILLHNLGRADYQVHISEPIAQLICERITIPKLREMSKLPRTEKPTAKASDPATTPITRDNNPRATIAMRVLRALSTSSTLILALCILTFGIISANGNHFYPKYATDQPNFAPTRTYNLCVCSRSGHAIAIPTAITCVPPDISDPSMVQKTKIEL
ncbi:MAG: hypothetical protein GY696_10440, partial [Gammaproteobacteria bacterium]|nr:hypothetical protein [Gammaproteobacteria bacterium]